jgi:hypothetical protein
MVEHNRCTEHIETGLVRCLEAAEHMGGGVSFAEEKSSSSSDDYPYRCYDRKLIQTLKVIFRSEFAKDAFINFIRHEEVPEEGIDQNYFKRANFALIGSNEEKFSEVLTRVGEQSRTQKYSHSHLSYPSHSARPPHRTAHDEYTYYSLKPFFESMDLATKRRVLDHKNGTARPMLTQFEKCHDEIILVMAIEALPRFETSESFQKWWRREKGSEFSISGLFSRHESSRRTATLHAATGKEIEGLWSNKGENIFPAILHCLNQFPVASALLHYDESRHYPMVYVSEVYATLFSSSVAELTRRPFNLMSSMTLNHINDALKQHHLSKGEIKYMREVQETSVGDMSDQHSTTATATTATTITSSLALAVKPIMDQSFRCIYLFVVVVDMTAPSFCLESLKLSMDLFEIFPSTLRIKQPLLGQLSAPLSSSLSENGGDRSRSSAH